MAAKVSDDTILESGDFLMSRSCLMKKFREANQELTHSQLPPESIGNPEFPDEPDTGVNRAVGPVKPEKASVLDALFSIGAIGTYVADITTDVLVAKQHFQNGDTAWFALTCIFIILPSLVMQIFSYKWFDDDYLNQTCWTYILHFFQLGTIERYLLAFWYGLKTRCFKPVKESDYIRYLTEWRDITLLRLIEGFMEAAPQMILQLYILASQKEFIINRDWLTATSAVVSIISLSWAIVSYSQMLRLCLNGRALSFCGYGFQILYRLLMVASRVTVLVLFASAFKEYIFLVVIGHCAVMFAWLSCIDTRHYSADQDEPILDKIFTFIVSVIYLFCFLSVHPTTTKKQVSIYYSILFVEGAAMMSAWFPYRTLEGVLMYASFGLVFGGFFGGLLCMLLYYRYFHPSQDVTTGWFCCLWFSRGGDRENSELEESTLKNVSFSYDDEDKELVVVKLKQKHAGSYGTQESPRPESPNRLSLPVELVRPHSPHSPHSPGKNEYSINNTELSEGSDRNRISYGSLSQSHSFDRDQKHRNVLSDGELENSVLLNGFNSNHKSAERCSKRPVRPGWSARVSKTVALNANGFYQDYRTANGKAKLGEMKIEMEMGSTNREDFKLDNNSNKLAIKRSKQSTKDCERKPLFDRQISKDDSFAIDVTLSADRSSRRRCQSLSSVNA